MTNMPWFKEWQDKRMGDVGYQDLDWEDLGLYHYLKNVAAQTRNAGSLTIYGKPHAGQQEIVALAKKRSMRTMRSTRAAADRAERMVRHLLDAGLIFLKPDGAIYISQWEDEQRIQSEHPDAIRKRDQRDRERATLMQDRLDGCPPTGGGGSDGRTPSDADRGGHAPSPPPPAPVPGKNYGPGEQRRPDESSPGHVRDMSRQMETGDRDRDCACSASSGSETGQQRPGSVRNAGGGGEGAWPPLQHGFDRDDPWDWAATELVSACAHFTRDFTSGMQALAQVALKQLGPNGFRDSLKEFAASKHTIKDKSPSAARRFIVGMWKRRGVVYASRREAVT